VPSLGYFGTLAAISASSRKSPRTPPDDSAESTGGRLRCPLPSPRSRTGHKRILSHLRAIQGHPFAKVVSLAFRL
jgi:hypothetical protein